MTAFKEDRSLYFGDYALMPVKEADDNWINRFVS